MASSESQDTDLGHPWREKREFELFLKFLDLSIECFLSLFTLFDTFVSVFVLLNAVIIPCLASLDHHLLRKGPHAESTSSNIPLKVHY